MSSYRICILFWWSKNVKSVKRRDELFESISRTCRPSLWR
jgi:hypothetical protein